MSEALHEFVVIYRNGIWKSIDCGQEGPFRALAGITQLSSAVKLVLEPR